MIEEYLAHRSLLFTVAYEMLGSAADAEDVVQESWLRWAGVDQSQVRDPRAYLVRITTRLALNRMRANSRRREVYVGPWLPEPVLTQPDVAADAELAESVSTAMLVVLESMVPTERAVFILHEVFDMPYAEIAEAVGKSSDAVRQIAHRARKSVHARRPRTPVDINQHRQATDRFRQALVTADIQSLMSVLAPDVVLFTDGGGVKKAALRPIHGLEKVVRFITGVLGTQTDFGIDQVMINGHPGLRISAEGEIDTVVTVRLDDGLVTAIYLVRNPAKLTHITHHTPLAR